MRYSSKAEHFGKSLPRRRWTMIAFVLVIGYILWAGVLSDPSGHLSTPSVGSILYTAAVFAVASLLAYTDQNRDSASKNQKSKSGHKTHPNTNAK